MEREIERKYIDEVDSHNKCNIVNLEVNMFVFP